MGELILMVLIVILVSFITTKIITIHYFNVIDDHVRGLLDDTKKAIQEVIGNKK